MTRLQVQALRANETVAIENGEGGWCSAACTLRQPHPCHSVAVQPMPHPMAACRTYTACHCLLSPRGTDLVTHAGAKLLRAAQQHGRSALVRSSPCGHPPLQRPTRLLMVTLWGREERPRRVDAEARPKATLWCRFKLADLRLLRPPP